MSDSGNKIKIADSFKNAAKKLSEKTVSLTEDVNKFIEKKRLEKYLPIYEKDLEDDSFRHQRLLRVINYDNRLDKELLSGSVGFFEKTPNRKIPTIYAKDVGKLGFSFFPYLSESVFIADPCIEGKFIEIDEYFNYMKQVRVNELTVIAQALGAKHVDIRLRTEAKKFSLVKEKGETGATIKGYGGEISAEREKRSSSRESFEVWASTDFKTGYRIKAPIIPQLLYFRNESDIQSLIQMATVNKSKLTKRSYCMKASSSSGISMTEAMNIGASLKVIKVKAGASFESNARAESVALLEYVIEF